jgi:hypothetical protein
VTSSDGRLITSGAIGRSFTVHEGEPVGPVSTTDGLTVESQSLMFGATWCEVDDDPAEEICFTSVGDAGQGLVAAQIEDLPLSVVDGEMGWWSAKSVNQPRISADLNDDGRTDLYVSKMTPYHDGTAHIDLWPWDSPYEDEEGDIFIESPPSLPILHMLRAGDVNGDGWTDIILQWHEDPYASTKLGLTEAHVHLGPHGDRLALADADVLALDGRTMDNPKDIDGDGADELIVLGAGAASWYRYAPGAVDFDRPDWSWRASADVIGSAIFGDLDGDGEIDLVDYAVDADSASDIRVRFGPLPMGELAREESDWRILTGPGTFGMPGLVDADGDGRDTLAVSVSGPGEGVYFFEL